MVDLPGEDPIAIVGVDIGSQSLKVVVTDEDLVVRGEASRDYPIRHPRPGWAEQDPLVWERALGPAVAEALAAAERRATDVRALAVAGQLDGCVGVDAATAPVTPCLMWMDRRADAEIPDSVDRERCRRVTGLVLDGTHMAAKIRWLARNAEPAARYHQPVSFLVARLTGEHVLDHGLASTTMVYALDRREYDRELLDAFAIRAESLPRIARAEDVAGHLTARGAELAGLPRGTPVAVGTGDDFSTPLGAGVAEPGPIACVLGTAEVVGAVAAEPVVDPAELVETHAYPGGLSFVENPGWLAGGALEWLRRILGAADAAELDALAAAAPPGSDGLLFVPALSGAMAPEWIASARGCFYGLTPAHDRSHMARAVMEGCAYAMCDVVWRLGELGVGGDSLLVLGGGARSRLWAEIRADASGLPASASARADTSAIGAALLAATAAGLADLREAAARARSRTDPIAPDRARGAIYQEAHARYRRLFDSLRPMYQPPA